MNYFDNLELVPNAVKEIVKNHDMFDFTYENRIKLLDKLLAFDWACDFTEDGKPFNLNTLNNEE